MEVRTYLGINFILVVSVLNCVKFFSVHFVDQSSVEKNVLHFSRSDQSDIHTPPGYTEIYDKSTGLISYLDNVQDLHWFTTLDPQGKLYFYNKNGDAVWELPQLPSILDGSGSSERSKNQVIPFLVQTKENSSSSATVAATPN